jgi:ubiquinone/menaquinone biosynthesis C-methylase UbiE
MADPFHDFELAGWQRAADAYPDSFGQLTVQAIEPLLDAVGAGPGVRLLDVATGPGYVAAAAAQRGADVVGIDFSPAMVEQAGRRYPGLDIRVGDADALAFEPASFEAAVVSFGLLHFAHPEQALREMRRVLRPGGRVAFTVWAPPSRAVGFRIVLDAIAAHGSRATLAPAGPPFFRFSEATECQRALEEVGFTAVTVVEVPMIWRLHSPDALFAAMTEGSVRTAATLNAQPPNARAAIRDAVRSAVATFASASSVELPMPCVLASASVA